MSKAILLVRVSTERQNFDEQERDLYNMALKDGYKDEDIIPIAEKESGIKLKEEERNGLNKMKEIIAGGDVSVVYAWEVSRIARKKKVLFSVTEYLAENRVNLIIKEPELRLLNLDGTINDSAETILTIYAQLAESEMRNKQARWQRTRIANAKAGKWNGGHTLKFGYSVDENNYYIINEEEAEIVRKVFEIYTTTHNGRTGVMREMQKLGYDITYNQVAKILTYEHYTGRILEAGSYRDRRLTSRFPAIISEETWEEAKRRRETNNTTAYKRTSYYFGRGLIRCPECGNVYVANKTNGWYVCAGNQMNVHHNERCRNNATIGINSLDTILWDATVNEYINANKLSLAEKIEDAKVKISDCEKIISAIEERLKKVDVKAKRYALLFGEAEIDEETYMQKKAQIAEERSQINSDRVSAEERRNYYQKIVNERDGGNMIDQLDSLAAEAFGINELKEMCETVHTFLERVEVSQDEKRNKYVTVFAVSGSVYKYMTYYRGRGGHKFFRGADEILMQSLSPWVEFTPNIIIRRKVAHLRKDKSMKEFVITRNNHMDYNIQNKVDTESDKTTGVKKMIELNERLKK